MIEVPSAPAMTVKTLLNAEPQAASISGPHVVSVGRVRAIDALRGFDMFWIVGAATIVKALNAVSENTWTKSLSMQLQHAQWEGVHFYDLIFPLFLFLI